eukprot:TRINITY_DN5385_c0_g2_i1.p1 TRINITY_DN5385_c0_g2~~TRINITY_DN5385_c0_g2_i1.p1  ORF type:complete len:1001 (+),score=132.65 TRINITY_DN5385_c0_g2_i1:49-3051(+)
MLAWGEDGEVLVQQVPLSPVWAWEDEPNETYAAHSGALEIVREHVRRHRLHPESIFKNCFKTINVRHHRHMPSETFQTALVEMGLRLSQDQMNELVARYSRPNNFVDYKSFCDELKSTKAVHNHGRDCPSVPWGTTAYGYNSQNPSRGTACTSAEHFSALDATLGWRVKVLVESATNIKDPSGGGVNLSQYHKIWDLRQPLYVITMLDSQRYRTHSVDGVDNPRWLPGTEFEFHTQDPQAVLEIQVRYGTSEDPIPKKAELSHEYAAGVATIEFRDLVCGLWHTKTRKLENLLGHPSSVTFRIYVDGVARKKLSKNKSEISERSKHSSQSGRSRLGTTEKHHEFKEGFDETDQDNIRFLLGQIRARVGREILDVREKFRVFDQFRTGYITESQFKRALSACGLFSDMSLTKEGFCRSWNGVGDPGRGVNLTNAEVDLLCRAYRAPDGRKINYAALSADVTSRGDLGSIAFLSRGNRFGKAHHVKHAAERKPVVAPAIDPDYAVEVVADTCRDRRQKIREVFSELTVLKAPNRFPGWLTPTAFLGALDVGFPGTLLGTREKEALLLKYADDTSGKQPQLINVKKFIKDIEAAMDRQAEEADADDNRLIEHPTRRDVLQLRVVLRTMMEHMSYAMRNCPNGAACYSVLEESLRRADVHRLGTVHEKRFRQIVEDKVDVLSLVMNEGSFQALVDKEGPETVKRLYMDVLVNSYAVRRMYMDTHREVEYRRFLADLHHCTEEQSKFLLLLPSSEEVALADYGLLGKEASGDLQALLARLRTEATDEGGRVEEVLQQEDHRRLGKVAQKRFEWCLSAGYPELDLSLEDRRVISEAYRVQLAGCDAVEYRRFLADLRAGVSARSSGRTGSKKSKAGSTRRAASAAASGRGSGSGSSPSRRHGGARPSGMARSRSERSARAKSEDDGSSHGYRDKEATALVSKDAKTRESTPKRSHSARSHDKRGMRKEDCGSQGGRTNSSASRSTRAPSSRSGSGRGQRQEGDQPA